MRREAGFALGLVLGLAILIGMGMVQRRADLLPSSDFAGIWAGGRAVVIGADPYDPSSWRSTTEHLGTQRPDTPVYGYPPNVALALAPLGLFPLDVAALVWMLSGISLAIIGVRALLRRHPCGPFAEGLFGLALLGSQPALTAFMLGQWSFHLTGALALAAAWHERSPWRSLAAATLGALAKPHLFVFALPALARRRTAIAGVLIAVIMLAATIAYPHWVTSWSTYVAPVRLPDPPRNPTLLGLAGELAGAAAVPVAALATAAAAGLVLARHGSLPAWLAVSILAAPYAWSYDHLLLLVPLALTAGSAPPRRGLLVAATGVIILVGLGPLMYFLAVVRGRETASGIVALAIFVLVLGSERARARATADGGGTDQSGDAPLTLVLATVAPACRRSVRMTSARKDTGTRALRSSVLRANATT